MGKKVTIDNEQFEKDLEKVRVVVNSCVTKEQFKVAGVYCNLFLKKYEKYKQQLDKTFNFNISNYCLII